MFELGFAILGVVLGVWLTRSFKSRKVSQKETAKGEDLTQRLAEIKHDYEKRIQEKEDQQYEREKELSENPERIVGGFFRIVERQRNRRKKDMRSE